VQRQLTLDLGTPPPSTFDNFHTGANAELVARLRGLDAALAAGPVADRTLYLWGEPGSGRSHLLHALVHEAPPGHARYLGPQSALAAFGFDPRVAIYAVDDCDALSGAQQIALFNLFNEVRAHPTCALVATGGAAPIALAVREDLRTRLGWGLVFHLAPLSDEGKAAVLKQAARERGIALADDVPAYLLTHFRRDMPSLMTLLDALDRFSLEQKRAVTLPLLRTMLAAGLPAPGEAADAAAADAAAVAPAGEAATSDECAGEIDGELDLRIDDSGDFTASGSAHRETPPEPVPFPTPTDNVDGELGAPFRDVVDRELGGALTGEVEADVIGELTGELGGELDTTASAATPDASASAGTSAAPDPATNEQTGSDAATPESSVEPRPLPPPTP
jgi:DnaA regulatory inactivator Hda